LMGEVCKVILTEVGSQLQLGELSEQVTFADVDIEAFDEIVQFSGGKV
jgi:hypothetical protein